MRRSSRLSSALRRWRTWDGMLKSSHGEFPVRLVRWLHIWPMTQLPILPLSPHLLGYLLHHFDIDCLVSLFSLSDNCVWLQITWNELQLSKPEAEHLIH